jgi:hypothetical protein
MARSRNKHGQFRAKRGDTKIGTIEKRYNADFRVRSDMNLSTYLSRNGVPSLGKALRRVERGLRTK